MITEHMTSQEALRAVRQKAPWADPNPGFKHQLDLFAAMGHKLDAGYEPYQAMLLSQQRQLATLNTRPLPKQLEVASDLEPKWSQHACLLLWLRNAEQLVHICHMLACIQYQCCCASAQQEQYAHEVIL